MDGGDSPADLGRPPQQQPQQQLKKLRRRKRHHHQQQQHRYADEDNNEADLDDELDNEDDHLDGEDDDEVIEYIQPDGAAAASASADGGSSHYDNYGGGGSGDGGNSDNWSRWMLAPSSSLLPRTDSLDHLRDDDDDYRGFGEAGAAANFNSYEVQKMQQKFKELFQLVVRLLVQTLTFSVVRNNLQTVARRQELYRMAHERLDQIDVC
uniref:Uncharacterized protein n=1 Tax=Macrostomum lignano TaxID=282301 RepID=A0A1I8GKY9_9PLAT